MLDPSRVLVFINRESNWILTRNKLPLLEKERVGVRLVILPKRVWIGLLPRVSPGAIDVGPFQGPCIHQSGKQPECYHAISSLSLKRRGRGPDDPASAGCLDPDIPL